MEQFFTDFYTNFVMSYSMLLLYALFVLLFRVLMMLAVNFDCKAKGNKNYVVWMILCFFFPIVASIVYACKRDKTDFSPRQCKKCGAFVHPDAQLCPVCGDAVLQRALEEKHSNQKKSHICFGVSIGAFVFAVVTFIITMTSLFGLIFDATTDGLKMADDFINDDGFFDSYDYDFDYDYDYDDDWSTHYSYDVNGVTTFYDKNGKAYTDEDDIAYYDKSGKVYTYDCDDYVFETNGHIELDEDYCYIDENGFFYFDESGWKDSTKKSVHYSAQYSTDSTSVYVDDKGAKYFLAYDVSWDKDGNMVDCYEGQPLIDNN